MGDDITGNGKLLAVIEERVKSIQQILSLLPCNHHRELIEAVKLTSSSNSQSLKHLMYITIAILLAVIGSWLTKII